MAVRYFFICFPIKHPKNFNHLEEVAGHIDRHSSNYEKYFLPGDFNCEPTEPTIKGFCLIHYYNNIIHDKTCFKNL